MDAVVIEAAKEVGVWNKLPKRVRDIVGVLADESGPNCWNATQIFHDESVEQRYTDESEMLMWLQENTTEISEDDIQFGDILVMHGHPIFGDELVHTAVYLGNGLYFHKGGFDKNKPYEIVCRSGIGYSYAEKCWYVRVNSTMRQAA